jgi:hypothetical protein
MPLKPAQIRADAPPGVLHPGEPLRTCPFCGGSDLWVSTHIDPKFVACNNCWAFGPTAPTVAQATERWNKTRCNAPWSGRTPLRLDV